MRPTLIIFARAPVAGRTKTRLGQGIGTVAAAWWARHQTARLIRRVGHDRRWRTVLAVAPDRAAGPPGPWPRGRGRWPQGPGDLGRRMARALARARVGPAVLVGTDIPVLQAAHIARAFRLLSTCDAVLGPAEDGGFWLIGVRRAGPRVRVSLLDGVRWGGAHALDDTLVALAPRRVALADKLADVDTAADLARMQGGRQADLPAPVPSERASFGR